MRPEVTIEYPKKHSDFYLHYRNQLQEQAAGIEIDPGEHVLRCFVNSEPGGVPGDVLRHRKVWIYMSGTEDVTVKEMSLALDLLKDVAQTVCDGYTEEFTGSHWIGTYNEKAIAALNTIDKILWSHGIYHSGVSLPEIY